MDPSDRGAPDDAGWAEDEIIIDDSPDVQED